jgi:hypothetical protein
MKLARNPIQNMTTNEQVLQEKHTNEPLSSILLPATTRIPSFKWGNQGLSSLGLCGILFVELHLLLGAGYTQ